MIETMGTVAAIDGEEVCVRVEQKGCGRCHEEGGCGGNSLGEMLCKSPDTFRLRNPGGVQVGDHVMIAVPDGSLLKTVVRAYLLPLLGLLLGALAGLELFGEIGAITGAVTSLLLVWVLVRHCRSEHLEPYIKC